MSTVAFHAAYQDLPVSSLCCAYLMRYSACPRNNDYSLFYIVVSLCLMMMMMMINLLCQVPEQKLSGLSLLLDRMCCEDGATRASLQNVVDVSYAIFDI